MAVSAEVYTMAVSAEVLIQWLSQPVVCKHAVEIVFVVVYCFRLASLDPKMVSSQTRLLHEGPPITRQGNPPPRYATTKPNLPLDLRLSQHVRRVLPL